VAGCSLDESARSSELLISSIDGSRDRGAAGPRATASSPPARAAPSPQGGAWVIVFFPIPGRVAFSAAIGERAPGVRAAVWNMPADGGSVLVGTAGGGLGAPRGSASASCAAFTASGVGLRSSSPAPSFGGNGRVICRSLGRSGGTSGSAGTPTTVFAAGLAPGAAISALPSLSALTARG
jgi:hypothetical protein